MTTQHGSRPVPSVGGDDEDAEKTPPASWCPQEVGRILTHHPLMAGPLTEGLCVPDGVRPRNGPCEKPQDRRRPKHPPYWSKKGWMWEVYSFLGVTSSTMFFLGCSHLHHPPPSSRCPAVARSTARSCSAGPRCWQSRRRRPGSRGRWRSIGPATGIPRHEARRGLRSAVWMRSGWGLDGWCDWWEM